MYVPSPLVAKRGDFCWLRKKGDCFHHEMSTKSLLSARQVPLVRGGPPTVGWGQRRQEQRGGTGQDARCRGRVVQQVEQDRASLRLRPCNWAGQQGPVQLGVTDSV